MILIKILVALTVLVGFVTPALAASDMPPGSFLEKPALSADELREAVRTNPTVRTRYAKHFGVSEDELERALEGVQLISLDTPQKTKVWYVNTRGYHRERTRLLPKGSMVFADRTGKPIILWRCGNPLVPKLKPVPIEALKPEKVVPIEIEVAGSVAEMVSMPPVMANPVPLASESAYDLVSLAASYGAGPVPLPPPIPSDRAFPWWIAGATLLGGDDPPPHVPEFPTTILAAIAVPMLLMAQRLRRK